MLDTAGHGGYLEPIAKVNRRRRHPGWTQC